MVMAWLSGMR